MKRKIEPYYVITWDFNKDQIEKYNIMDYLINCYKETKKRKLDIPKTFEEYKNMLKTCNKAKDIDRIKAINERILELQELLEGRK